MKRYSIVLAGLGVMTVLALGMARFTGVWMGRQPDGSFLVSTGQRIEGGSIAFTGRRMETLEDYLALFAAAKADQLLGEASTSYLWSTTAAKAIADVQPTARIIAIPSSVDGLSRAHRGEQRRHG